MKTPKNNNKGIGDTTSFTIPERFIHLDTNEAIPVSAKMLQFINDNISKRNLVHAIMTCVYNQNHGSPQNTIEFDRLEDKMDIILQKINEGKVVLGSDSSTATKNNIEATVEDINSIIDNFGD